MGQVKNLLIELLDDRSDESLSQLVALGCDRNLEPVPPMVSTAAFYLQKGISVVPQIPGAKSPTVKWKPYQTELPSIHQALEWWEFWPEAGIAFVLGPASNLFIADVDGTPAHHALVKLLGRVPKTPMVRSGSGKKHRYHLLFQHPGQRTNAKATPVHPKLEFKGFGGIAIAPPSVHESGRSYEWVQGRSIYEIDRAPTPEPIQRALKKYFENRTACHAVPQQMSQIQRSRFRGSQHLDLSDSTLRFLAGEFANKSLWNDRIFRASCDLAGRGYPIEIAKKLILAGAQPWTQQDERNALCTIESAYSQPRKPGLDYEI